MEKKMQMVKELVQTTPQPMVLAKLMTSLNLEKSLLEKETMINLSKAISMMSKSRFFNI